MGTSESAEAVLKRVLIKHVLGRIVGLVSLALTPIALIVAVIECSSYGWDMGEEVEDLYDHMEKAVHMIIFGGSA